MGLPHHNNYYYGVKNKRVNADGAAIFKARRLVSEAQKEIRDEIARSHVGATLTNSKFNVTEQSYPTVDD